MGILSEHGYATVHHYAPMHYLPFVARSQALRGKPELHKLGYPETHFRSKSKAQDKERGFGDYVHLTLHPAPPILRAKLAGGFPHFRLAVSVGTIEELEFDLCRYNIAMTRQLRREGKSGHSESDENGRYYSQRQIPIARSLREKQAMLERAALSEWMVEVLVNGRLDLPADCKVFCYSSQDVQQVEQVLWTLDCDWRAALDGERILCAPSGV